MKWAVNSTSPPISRASAHSDPTGGTIVVSKPRPSHQNRSDRSRSVTQIPTWWGRTVMGAPLRSHAGRRSRLGRSWPDHTTERRGTTGCGARVRSAATGPTVAQAEGEADDPEHEEEDGADPEQVHEEPEADEHQRRGQKDRQETAHRSRG